VTKIKTTGRIDNEIKIRDNVENSVQLTAPCLDDDGGVGVAWFSHHARD